MLKFLIILSNDEYKEISCWNYSKMDKILHNVHLFPGKLEVLSFTQYMCSIQKYRFINNRIPLKNRIYIRIPKEKIYVLLEDYTKYLVYSQLIEVNSLFLKLNAENVKIKYVNENLTQQQPPQILLAGIHPGLDEYIVSMGANDHDSVEIRYSLPKHKIDLNIVKYFYYEKWESFVKRRIEDAICYDNFFFKYERPDFLNETFFNEMRTCGLDVSFNMNEIYEFELHFEIFYYPDEMI
jgi:hypothetical protein